MSEQTLLICFTILIDSFRLAPQPIVPRVGPLIVPTANPVPVLLGYSIPSLGVGAMIRASADSFS